MGDVYLAQHESTGGLVAIKRARDIDSAQLASLRREIYALSRLRHPGIVRLVDHGTVDGMPWCALEYVDGQTMQTVLEPPDASVTGPAVATATTATMGIPFETTPPGDGIPYLHAPRFAAPIAPPPPHVVEKCLAAMRPLCEALGFLHGEGIVHCDLKPANIVLRPSGAPVIIDFGLMVHFSGPHGRERLDEGWAAVGTYEYMAPERIRRELVDARADLYAVGCILYEIFTGRPPFMGDQRQVLRQHVATKPPPPSAIAPGVPAQLDDLVLRLLEKDPRARLGYADSVAAVLEAAGIAAASMPADSGRLPTDSARSTADSGRFPSDSTRPPVDSARLSSDSPTSSADSRKSPADSTRSFHDSTRAPSLAPRARAYLYRPAFAGHAAPLRRITMEPGGLVLLGAESGAGKTRFALEVGRALAGEMRIVTGECLPLGAESAAVLGAPLHPLAPLLRAIGDECRSQGPGMTEILLGRRGRVLGDYEPTLLDLPEVAELPQPARLSPEAAQQRLYGDLAETMFAFATLQRLVLILDDLQWSDELTLGFLRSLVPASLSDQGVLVLGTYRKDEAGEALRALAREPGTRRMDLERLDRASVTSIARDMLALRDPPAPLVDWLYTCSNGNPFFVAEYLRSAVEEGLVARDARGSWGAGPTLGSGADLGKLPVPGSVRQLLEIRLDALARGAQRWVEAASVLGREIDRDVLERVARPEGSSAPTNVVPVAGRARLVSVEELLARQILEEAPRGFRFVHDMLREVAYERIAPARKKALHLAAARAIEEVFTERHQLSAAHATLAHHYGAAEVDDKTFFYLERAAEGALASGMYSQAHALLTRLLALDSARGKPVLPLVRARYHRWLGEASYAMGDLTGLGEHTAEGLAELGHPLPRSAFAWGGALASGLARQVAAFVSKRVLPENQGHSSASASQEAGLPEDGGARAEIAQMAAQLAFRYYFAGDAAGMIAASLLAVNEAEGASSAGASAGTPRGLSRPYAYLGYLTGLARLHPIAHAYFRQAAEAGRAAGDSDGVAHAFTTEAAYRMGLGEWHAAEQAAQEALSIQMANDNAMEAELLHTILGHIEYFTGRFDASRRRFETLVKSAAGRHHEQHRAWGLYAAARCDLAQGRTAEAIVLLREAELLLQSLSDEASVLIVDGLFASAHIAEHDLARAVSRAERIAQRIDRMHVPTVFSTVHAYVALAEVRLVLWEEGGSKGRPRRALTALRAVALLTGFAALFPFAGPAARRCASRARFLLGQRKEALRLLEKSIETAHALGMPHEEALSRNELSRFD